MKFMFQIIKEQVLNCKLIFQLAIYDTKGKYQLHYLGVFWQFLNPLIQISIYWLIFGLGFRGGKPVGEIPYIIWMLAGIIPWFYIAPTIVQGSNSIYARVNLVSKMKFPVSALPTTVIVGNAFAFFVMMVMLGIVLCVYHINPGLFLLQLPYYLFCLFFLLFSVTLLYSSLSTIVRDFQLLLQSVMRMLFYLTPVLWVPGHFPEILEKILKLNPFYYIIDGFRNTLFGEHWFFQNLSYTFYFWIVAILIFFLGSTIHIKFRNKFVDYL